MFEASIEHDKTMAEVQTYLTDYQKIQSDAGLDEKLKKKLISRLPQNPKWVSHLSLWWGRDNVSFVDRKLHPHADIAVARLEPFDPSWVTNYPIFKTAAGDDDLGTSLCKLGFPFSEVNVQFDQASGAFQFTGRNQLPFFPLDGIFTRRIEIVDQESGLQIVKLIETSTPGLPGQSGGPVFDTDGIVWGIQTSNTTFALQLNMPALKVDGKEIQVPQFLNAGWAVGPETICDFLTSSSIKFSQKQLK